MTEHKLLETFVSLFPLFKVKRYAKAGKQSIYIYTENDMKFVFTFKGKTNWRFETAKMFGEAIAKENA